MNVLQTIFPVLLGPWATQKAGATEKDKVQEADQPTSSETDKQAADTLTCFLPPIPGYAHYLSVAMPADSRCG